MIQLAILMNIVAITACMPLLLIILVISLHCVLLLVIVPHMAISNWILTSLWACSWKDVEGLLYIH